MTTIIQKRHELREILNEYKGGYWRTKDGRFLKECEMNDSHVSSLLDYIERNHLVDYWECDATEADIY